jgi:hypothetical protein
MGKKKLSVLSDADDAALRKLGKKKRAQAVSGKPDQSDIDNLNELFRLYEQSNPGKLQRMANAYKVEKTLKDTSTPAFRGITSDELKMSMWLPEDLQQFLEEYYPTIFTRKDHLEWFLSKFPIFRA